MRVQQAQRPGRGPAVEQGVPAGELRRPEPALVVEQSAGDDDDRILTRLICDEADRIVELQAATPQVAGLGLLLTAAVAALRNRQAKND